MTAQDSRPVTVILSRVPSDHPWADYRWSCIGVVPADENDDGAPRVILKTETETQFSVGPLRIELYRGETGGYLRNLSQPSPSVYVALRDGEADDPLDRVPFLATVCPYEAEKYVEDGAETVDSVPLPPTIAAWVQAFVEAHHVEETFIKRKRGPKRQRAEPFSAIPRVSRNDR
ncbi:MAG: DUF3305 domain-containing protein [Magnetospiraceae bacterium]